MKLFPSLDWIRNYDKSWLSGDISAGLTVGVMLIPQGMAYSMLAGLPPIHGLYAVTIPLIVYALMGTSRQLAVGPVAMVSLLISSGVGQLAAAGTEEYISYAILLALMVGVLQLLMGIFRIGFLVNFLSHPVIAGFTSAAAVVIGFSQLKHILGVKTEGESVIGIFKQIMAQVQDFHFISIMIGMGSIITLILVKKLHKKIPAPLVVVTLGILIVSVFALDQSGVKIVKEIPSGFPMPALPIFDWGAIQKLLPTAFAISFVGFMESIAVAKAIQAKHKDYELSSNQELIALGTANIVASALKAFPITGGFSRTAVNDQAGAKTGLASIISAFLIILTLLFLTSYFYFLPNAVLAAIILVAVYGLIDFKEAKHLWHADRTDFALFLVAALGTLLLGIEEGILVGVVLSMGILIYRVSYPHMAELGRVPGTTLFRNVDRFENLEMVEGVAILRIDAPIFFANLSNIQERIQKLRSDRPQTKKIIIDAAAVSHLDSSGAHMLHDLHESLKEKGIQLHIAQAIGPVRDAMQTNSLIEKIGADHFHPNLESAVRLDDTFTQKDRKALTLQTNIKQP